VSDRWRRIAVPGGRHGSYVLEASQIPFFSHYCRVSVHCLSTNTYAIPVGLDLDHALVDSFDALLVCPTPCSGSQRRGRGNHPRGVGWTPHVGGPCQPVKNHEYLGLNVRLVVTAPSKQASVQFRAFCRQFSKWGPVDPWRRMERLLRRGR
jgi:hypothetical protein